MKRHKMIGSELCAGEVMICRKCKINFPSTPNPKNNKPYLWCPDCRTTLYNTRGKKQNNLIIPKSRDQYQKMMKILLTLRPATLMMVSMMLAKLAQLITLIRSLVN